MKRDGFSSQFGALMAMIGSAVGLGGLWKFPYTMGQNGGAAFIIIYILFLLVLCFPLILSEYIIGRRSQSNPVGAFKVLAPNTRWYLTGLLGVIISTIILSFYSVVGGWTLKYIFLSFYPGIKAVAAENNYFNTFKSSSFDAVLMHLLFLGATVGILWTGVKNGIEKYSKVLMPLLFLMITGLAIFSMNLPGAERGIQFLIHPDFNAITPAVVLEALGMGLFTLSLGMAITMTYSSYIDKKENLFKLSSLTILMSIIFALLAGFTILPAVFSFGYQPDVGPSLIFIILPKIFGEMPFGNIIAPVFFIVAFIAAISSSISLLEVLISYLVEEWKISRKKALIFSGLLLAITGTFCSLSLGILSDWTLFELNIFDLSDTLSSTILMPICAFLISIFVGWRMKKEDVYDELSNHSTIKIYLFPVLWFLIRFFVPIAILIVFLNTLNIF